jgi:hypothetical protein
MSETEVYRERANKYMRFAATMSSPEAKAVMLSGASMARIGAVTPDSQTGCEQPQWLLNGGILGCIKVSVTSVPSRVVRPECADLCVQ